MMKEFDIKDYKKVTNEVKEMFLNERLGNQQSYAHQEKLFKPLIDTTKSLEQKIVDDKQNLSNILVPFTDQIMRANDQREAIQAMPFYTSDIVESTPKREIKIINLDKKLNDTDRDNLLELSLPLPSEVYDNNEIEQTLVDIAQKNRKLGQFLRVDSTKTERERIIYESQKDTLKKYKDILKSTKEGSKLLGEGLRKKKLVKLKRGRGRPMWDQVTYYENPRQLFRKLDEYITALHAGNNGVYNTAVSILDELLQIKAISKENYDIIYKNYFEIV